MKRFLTTTAAAAVIALCVQAYAELPQARPLARYQPMMERSPFAVATVVATPPPAPTFAKELFIANAARLENESIVTLNSSTDKNFREYLSTKGPNESGYSIVDIQWSDRVGETKVTIAKDGNTATLSFNQALLTQPMAGGAVPQMPQMQQTGMVPPAPAAYQQPQVVPAGKVDSGHQVIQSVNPPPIPPLPTPPPRTRAVIQRNPAGQAPPNEMPEQQ